MISLYSSIVPIMILQNAILIGLCFFPVNIIYHELYHYYLVFVAPIPDASLIFEIQQTKNHDVYLSRKENLQVLWSCTWYRAPCLGSQTRSLGCSPQSTQPRAATLGLVQPRPKPWALFLNHIVWYLCFLSSLA